MASTIVSLSVLDKCLWIEAILGTLTTTFWWSCWRNIYTHLRRLFCVLLNSVQFGLETFLGAVVHESLDEIRTNITSPAPQKTHLCHGLVEAR